MNDRLVFPPPHPRIPAISTKLIYPLRESLTPKPVANYYRPAPFSPSPAVMHPGVHCYDVSANVGQQQVSDGGNQHCPSHCSLPVAFSELRSSMHVRKDIGGACMARRFKGGAVWCRGGQSVGGHHRRLLGGDIKILLFGFFHV